MEKENTQSYINTNSIGTNEESLFFNWQKMPSILGFPSIFRIDTRGFKPVVLTGILFTEEINKPIVCSLFSVQDTGMVFLKNFIINTKKINVSENILQDDDIEEKEYIYIHQGFPERDNFSKLDNEILELRFTSEIDEDNIFMLIVDPSSMEEECHECEHCTNDK